MKPGSHVTYRGADWTVLRLGTLEPAVLCKEGHPPRWGGRTNWFFTDELEVVE